jgi:hypothetical protein
MTASQVNREVSRATGESVREIRRRGFCLADSADLESEAGWQDRRPLTVDWDSLDAERQRYAP